MNADVKGSLSNIDPDDWSFKKKTMKNPILARLGFSTHKEYFDNEERLKLTGERCGRIKQYKELPISELKKDLYIILSMIHAHGGVIDEKYLKKFRLNEVNKILGRKK